MSFFVIAHLIISIGNIFVNSKYLIKIKIIYHLISTLSYTKELVNLFKLLKIEQKMRKLNLNKVTHNEF